MKALVPAWTALDSLLQKMDQERKISVAIQSGLPYLLLRLVLSGRSALAICGEEKAGALLEDVRALASLFSESEKWSLGAVLSGAPEQRNALLEDASQKLSTFWAASPESLKEPCFSRGEFAESRFPIKVGKVHPYSKLINRLSEGGYGRTGLVENVGEFSVRGEVFDFWSPGADRPVRLVFHNDVVESMHAFDPGEQRTLEFVAETVIVPMSQRQVSGTLFDHLPQQSIVVALEDAQIPKDFPVLAVSPGGANLGLLPATQIRLNWTLFQAEISQNLSQGTSNYVFCRNMGEVQRMEDALDGMRLAPQERPQLLVSPINEGFKAAALGLAVWSFREIVGGSAPAPRLPKFRSGRLLESIAEIAAGDFVVHENFGIGRYRGLERLSLKTHARAKAQEKESEFLLLEYRGGDRLYVPIQDFRLVQKYVGSEGKRPALNSLDRIAWERMKQKVRQEVADLAKELLQTAATREIIARPSADRTIEGQSVRHLLKEFEDSFPYEETPDQEEAIKKVMTDLESNRLMEHLVCGDVGYGKTEIAMRAAFRTVCDSKQVAVLVPTTILAEQHFKTFTERFAAFPVKIGMLSRFQTKEDQRRALEYIKAGAVDIVIGTHRLIQKDVHFQNLGLIVIDEEHRFGVKQKEALKRLRVTADFLALSATPIPRTLSLAMGGIRNISVVESPPQGRLPIETHVGLFDEELLKEAVARELGRGGQIFYVHNRISTIETRKDFLEKLFPKIRVGIAHGQMSAEALEKAMWNFLQKKWDILLSTTIIESGLDIPSVNTLVVEDTEEFGLAQLYQLRGRVGRQRQKAHCLLFFSDWAKLSEDARKRLTAIQEFSALGSGMKLALRDMEIRGTGNLLGPQQHGWIAAVGLDLYCRLLSEEVSKIKSGESEPVGAEETETETGPEIELQVSAFIPESYVEMPGERITLYKKMLAAKDGADLESIQAELLDRFGPLPREAENLLKLMSVRLEARESGVQAVDATPKGLILTWAKREEEIPIDLARFAADQPALIEILPPGPVRKGSASLRILFKEEGADLFALSKKFLKLSFSYATIKTHAKI